MLRNGVLLLNILYIRTNLLNQCFSYYLGMVKEVGVDNCRRAQYYIRREDLNKELDKVQQQKVKG